MRKIFMGIAIELFETVKNRHWAFNEWIKNKAVFNSERIGEEKTANMRIVPNCERLQKN